MSSVGEGISEVSAMGKLFSVSIAIIHIILYELYGSQYYRETLAVNFAVSSTAHLRI